MAPKLLIVLELVFVERQVEKTYVGRWEYVYMVILFEITPHKMGLAVMQVPFLRDLPLSFVKIC